MKKRTIWKNFYVLEGLDGSGTSTQLELLISRFRKDNRPVEGTCEPTALPVGRFIRQILRKEERVMPETLARLFSADRYEHLYHGESGVKTWLEQGKSVFCDRYLFSSLAYQSLECGFETVLSLNDFPLPEKIFFLDVPPEICAGRLARRDMVELFENREIQERLLKNYREALAYFDGSGMEIYFIDGTQPPENVLENILSKL